MAGSWRDATVALRATQWRCAAAVDKLALWLRGATQLPVLMLLPSRQGHFGARDLGRPRSRVGVGLCCVLCS